MALAVPPDGAEPLPGPQLAEQSARPNAGIEAPILSVVVVNFCQGRNTTRLTRQLRRSDAARERTAEIIIIDNDAGRNRSARLPRRRAGVSVYRTRSNLGFAKAVNRGVARCRGDWVLLLNPDMTVAEGFLDVVVAASRRLAEESRAGVVGFQLHNGDGSRQASAGPFPTFGNTLGGLFLPRSRRRCRHQDLSAHSEVEWVTGGCLLVRRDCFRQLGGFDEAFFLYYEDVDFCRRARAGGWSVVYEPGVAVTHHWPLHTRSVPAPLRLLTRQALLGYARKHWPRWQTGVLGGLVWLEAHARGLAARVRGDGVASGCYQRLRGLVGDVLQNRDRAARQKIRYAARFLAPIAAAQDLPAT